MFEICEQHARRLNQISEGYFRSQTVNYIFNLNEYVCIILLFYLKLMLVYTVYGKKFYFVFFPMLYAGLVLI